MAMKIDPDACIDCGACVDTCPNKAIVAGGESYTLNGATHPALSDKYYVIPEKCTHCVGYTGDPQCVQACPVDCIAEDPSHQETAEQLKAKAEQLKTAN